MHSISSPACRLLTILALGTALVTASGSAQAAFEFMNKAKPAATAAATTPTVKPVAAPAPLAPIVSAAPAMAPQPVPAKPAPVTPVVTTPASAMSANSVLPTMMTPPAPAVRPSMAPVTPASIIADEPEITAADMAKAPSVPDWTARPAPTAVIPLTPIVAESDSLEIFNSPLLPDDTMSAAPIAAPALPPVAAPREVLASTDPVPAKPAAINWDAPTATAAARPVVTEHMLPAPAAPAPIIETTIEPAPDLAPADDAVVEGFGKDMPMVMALRQIVPANYRFSFDPAVNPGRRVSWQGGRPWSQVVKDMAAKQGLQAEIAGNVVAIRQGGSPSALSAAPVAPRDAIADLVLNDRTPMAGAPLPPPMPVTPKHAVMPAQPALAGDAPLSLTDAPQPDAAMPVLNKSIDVSETTTMTTTKSATTTTVAGAGAATLAPPASTPVKPAAMPQAVPPITETEEVGDKLTPPPIVPLQDKLQATTEAHAVATAKTDMKPADLTVKQEWLARSGQSLRTILQDWSKQANVSLVWSSDFDYPLQTDLRIQGTYPDAVRTLLAGFSKAQPKPIGRLHANTGVGAQPVLIVDTQRLIKD